MRYVSRTTKVVLVMVAAIVVIVIVAGLGTRAGSKDSGSNNDGPVLTNNGKVERESGVDRDGPVLD